MNYFWVFATRKEAVKEMGAQKKLKPYKDYQDNFEILDFVVDGETCWQEGFTKWGE